MGDQCVLKGMAVYNGNGILDNTCHTNLMICDWCNRQVCGAHGAETYYEVGLKVSCDECIAQNKLFDINGNLHTCKNYGHG